MPPFPQDGRDFGQLHGSANGLIGAARTIASLVLGVAAGALAVEAGLRFFASPVGPPTPNVRADSLVEDTLVRRELHEGVSLAHYSVAGARLTGNAQIPTAPTVVLLGDSYVAAEAVADQSTMGSYLERSARAAGVRMNVRQYGWVGASPSTYLMVGHEVIRRWNPIDVVIALGDNDLDEKALHEGSPRLRVLASGALEIVPPALPASAAPGFGSRPRSVLRALLAERTWVLQWRHAQASRVRSAPAGPTTTTSAVLPDSVQLAMLPRAVVRALAATFGPRLAIVYLAEVGVQGDDGATTIERRLFEACTAEHVRCANTRPSMLAARRAGIIVHGFFNTTPGNGHLNPAGHALVAAEIWKLLRRPAAQTVGGEVR